MKTMRTGLACAALILLAPWAAQAADKSELVGDAKAINQACQAEAATAGCGQEVVGKGLLKCLGAYRKAHSDFKVSDGCRDAIKQLADDRREHKQP
jgi:opacity protein-like surface antigen